MKYEPLFTKLRELVGFWRKSQGALGGDRSVEQAKGFETCRPVGQRLQQTNTQTTLKRKPRQQELQELSNTTKFGEMVRQLFARNCFSGGGTYSCKKPSNTNKSKMLQTSDMEKRNTEGHNVWSFVLILFLLANMFFWGGDWDPHQEKMYGKE